MRILIAEDDPISRTLLQKILSPYGLCETSVNGEEAVRMFQEAWDKTETYSLVCLDIMMPEMDGQEALKRIRQIERENGIERENETPVIMTTALDTPKDVIEAYYRGGCTSYLVKPITKGKMNEILTQLGIIQE